MILYGDVGGVVGDVGGDVGGVVGDVGGDVVMLYMQGDGMK